MTGVLLKLLCKIPSIGDASDRGDPVTIRSCRRETH